MKATGVVRRIDDLGRIVIPKEIRRTLRIREGDPLEVFVDNGGEIILKKYSPIGELSEFAQSYIDAVHSTVKHNILVTDRDNVIAGSGTIGKKYLNKELSDYLEKILAKRESILENNPKEIMISTLEKEKGTYVISPIIANGDAVGLVVLLSENDTITEADEKLAKIAAQYFGTYIED